MIQINKITYLILLISFISQEVHCQTSPQSYCYSSKEKLLLYVDSVFSLGFNGSVLVLKNGDVMVSRNKGKLGQKSKANIDEATVYYLASVSKQFTAAGIIKLQSEGKLNIQDKISDHISDIPDDKTEITIHQLLTHTSGLQEYRAESGEIINKETMLNRIYADSLLFEPGSSFSYSNQGYGMLAAIIESASGMTFQNYMHKNFFDQLSMKNTGFIGDKIQGNAVVGYYNGDAKGSLMDWQDKDGWAQLGSGGMYSSLNDLLIWERALMNSDVLNTSEQGLLAYTHYKTNTNYYGYGLRIQKESFGGTLVYHFGSDINGFSAGILRFPENEISVVVMSNILDEDYSNAIDTAVKIAHKVFECDYDKYPKYKNSFQN